MKKNKGIAPIAVILILLGIVIIGGTAYYAGKNSSNFSQNEDILVNTENDNKAPNPNPTPTPRVCIPTTPAWIEVTTPNGGEIYQIGDVTTFKWSSCNIDSGVVGELVGISNQNNSKSLFGEGGGSSNTGELSVNFGPIPSTGVQWINSGTYKFKVSKFGDNTVFDSSDDSFTLNTKSAVENPTDAAEKNGKHIGYIKNIVFSNGDEIVTIDYIQMNNCTPNVPNVGDCPNGFKILNTNPLTRTFSISSSLLSGTPIKMQTYWQNGQQISNISVATLKSLINSTSPTLSYWKTIPFWITLNNGIITDISEQYLP
ncbi:MAG: hypothetical protein WDK96_03725 [Candidatus Paceibacterota bacterium]|jgi:hypothetical protein